MAFYKYVSGKGKTELSQKEISEMISDEEIKITPSRLDILEQRLEKLLSFFEKIGLGGN